MLEEEFNTNALMKRKHAADENDSSNDFSAVKMPLLLRLVLETSASP